MVYMMELGFVKCQNVAGYRLEGYILENELF